MAKYTSPTWVNGSSPPLSAANMQALTDRVEANQVPIASITFSSSWTLSGGVYSQAVTVTGASITAASKIDLQPSPAQTEDLIGRGVQAMIAVNNNGSVTVYAIGADPGGSWSIQCAVTETV